MFVIYTNDVVKLFDEYCVVRLYANDLKCMYASLAQLNFKATW